MKNNKGFMLAEVVVTSTVVLTTLIGLYVSFNKLYKNYDIRSTYYDIDGIYAIKSITNILLDNEDLNTILNKFTSSNSTAIIENSTCKYGNIDGNTKCTDLQSEYYIQNLYITTYDKPAVNSLKTKVSNQTFKDYLNFVEKKYNLNNNYTAPTSTIESDTANKYNYLFIIEYKKNDDKYYYASLGLG